MLIALLHGTRWSRIGVLLQRLFQTYIMMVYAYIYSITWYVHMAVLLANLRDKRRMSSDAVFSVFRHSFLGLRVNP